VVTEGVETIAARACAGGQREGQAQPAEQEYPELRAGNDEIRISWQDREDSASVRPRL
jgi:hypothetical protein